ELHAFPPRRSSDPGDNLWIAVDNSASAHFTAFIHRCIPNRVFLWITTETSTRAFFRKIGHITRKTGPVRGGGRARRRKTAPGDVPDAVRRLCERDRRGY